MPASDGRPRTANDPPHCLPCSTWHPAGRTIAFRYLADAVAIVHLAFVVFVVAGGLLALRWPHVAWVHVPCAAWGALIEFAGWICPLTPLENHLRRLGGQAGYAGGFVDRYVFGALYPAGLTREMQVALGLVVVLLNLAVYAWAWRRRVRAEARG